ncbi:sensor histidine kinase [Pontibacter vulgaris]|uniref:sensor histidine kinase n=1 Tax=Pontibacter vulgaris TaxID=2905679 RepID=UPI001FA6C644|nr:ATP-binding protein [Pontibacter vulgaris]
MAYNRFRVRLLLRVALLLLSMVALLLILYRTDWHIASVCVGLFMLLLIYDLVHYVERTNRDITGFLEAIRHSDFTQRFAVQGADPSYRNLYQAFNDISTAFQKIKSDKQAHHLYLQAIVEHVGIGLLCFNEAGEINLVNHVTMDMLHTPYLKNIHALNRISEELVEVLLEMENNEKRLVTMKPHQDELMLTLHASTLVSQGQTLKIVSLQNIRSEMEEQELQTWQKLIRVLTHEIMNSMTPVVSLASTVNNMVEYDVEAKYKAGEVPDREVFEDIRDGLQTIEKRSAGMLHFVKNYRRLMRVPTPELQTVNVTELLKQVHTLMQTQPGAKRVQFEFYVPDEKLEITADPELIEQVLINLVKNGMEACDSKQAPCVQVIAYREEQDMSKVYIKVQDNGPGIEPDVLDKLFIPFYTTKKQGSGIGLSLSKQIMRQHGGSIRVSSQPGGPTTFTLVFNA